MMLQKTATKLPFLLCAIIVSLGGLMGLVLQDNLFAHHLFALAGLILLIPFALLLAAIAIVFLLLKRKINKWLSLSFAITCALALAIVFFLVVNGRLDAWKNENVRKYVAHAVPLLDEIKIRTGSYPETLPVSSFGEPPELFRRWGSYSGYENIFIFDYMDEPAGWAGGGAGWEFHSYDREWKAR